MKEFLYFKYAHPEQYLEAVSKNKDLDKIQLMFRPYKYQIGKFYRFTIPEKHREYHGQMETDPEESLLVIAEDVSNLEVINIDNKGKEYINRDLKQVKDHGTMFKIISYSGGEYKNKFMHNGYLFFQSNWKFEEI